MSSDDSNSALAREVEEFTRKVEAATQLTRSDFAREAKRVHDIAFFQDPAAGGKTTSIKRASALHNHLDALLERVRPQIRDRFKPIAQIARRYSPSDLLLAFVLDAPQFITVCENPHQDWLGGMCDFYGHPNAAASFSETYRRVFIEDWNRLVWETELEEPFTSDQTARSQPQPARRIRKRLSKSKTDSSSRKRPPGSQTGVQSAKPITAGAAAEHKEEAEPRSAHGPPRAELLETRTPIAAAENSPLIELLQSSRRKPLSTLLSLVRAENPELEKIRNKTRALLLASDKRISDIRSEAERKRCYRLIHDSVPPGWKDGIGEQKSLVAYWDHRDAKDRGPIKSYVSDVKLVQ